MSRATRQSRSAPGSAKAVCRSRSSSSANRSRNPPCSASPTPSRRPRHFAPSVRPSSQSDGQGERQGVVLFLTSVRQFGGLSPRDLLQDLFDLRFREPEIIKLLQIHPEGGACAEVASKPERRIRGDCAPSLQN